MYVIISNACFLNYGLYGKQTVRRAAGQQETPSPEPAPEAIEELDEQRRRIYVHSGGVAQLRALQTTLDALEAVISSAAAASAAVAATAQLVQEEQQLMAAQPNLESNGSDDALDTTRIMAQQDAEYAVALECDLQRQAERKDHAELSAEEIRERRRRHFEQPQQHDVEGPGTGKTSNCRLTEQ